MRVPTSRRHRRTTQRAAVQRRLHDERTRISQDLHDHVGAQLSAVLSGIDLARLSACGSVFPDSTAATLDRIEAHARAAMAHLRETVWALHHKTVPLPAFRDRLRRYAHGQVALRTDAPTTHCRLDTTALGKALPPVLAPMQALHLYRIAQEAILNALKHAGASRLDVGLIVTPNALKLVVRDDGCFAAEAPMQPIPSGYGLDGMRRRAERLGGGFSLTTEGGTTVRVTLPTNPVSASLSEKTAS